MPSRRKPRRTRALNEIMIGPQARRDVSRAAWRNRRSTAPAALDKPAPSLC
jgi:hypothetical protein